MSRLALTLALGAALLAASAAATPNPANQGALDRTVRYLQEAQQRNGGFGGSGEPSQITSAWTALALAAAGINSQDQARPGGADAFAYLVSHYRQGIEESECAPVACTTTFERELMVVNAAGARPHDFGGVDLVSELLDRALPDGSFPHVPGGKPGVNDTIFAIFALAPIEEPAAQAPIQRAAEWVEAQQQEDGSWSWKDRDAPGEVDMTGAAIQALVAAGRAGTTAVEEGLDYLHAAQNPDGGFPEFPGNPESNVASTSWAVQAIWAVGENPEAWLSGSGAETEEPLDYMESLQAPDGHIRWKRSRDLNGVWMTAYTTPAFAGQPWPIPAAPRARPSVGTPKSGQGEGTQSGEGTIAGGGSAGAPLFSRPRPQSKGKTPGGARLVGENVEAENHSETRHGETSQPSGTETVEAQASESQVNPTVVGASSSGNVGDDETGGPVGTPLPPALFAASEEDRAGELRTVTGTLVGSADSARRGELAFGAPGLHSAGAEDGVQPAALGIGALALLAALGGAGWERRRRMVTP